MFNSVGKAVENYRKIFRQVSFLEGLKKAKSFLLSHNFEVIDDEAIITLVLFLTPFANTTLYSQCQQIADILNGRRITGDNFVFPSHL
jgi:hypothetical protein